MSTVKVGDELASVPWHGFAKISKVVKITPSGMIKLENGVTLKKSLSIHGGVGMYEIATAEVKAEIERSMLNHRFSKAELTTDQLRRIVAILDEGAAHGA